MQEDVIAELPTSDGNSTLDGTSNLSTSQITNVESCQEVEEEVSPHDQSSPSKPVDAEFNSSGTQHSTDTRISEDNEVRLEALAKEREALRDEVAQLRMSLEELRGKHEEESGNFKAQLRESQGEKDHAELQYRNLLGKVNTIKSQLGERLKADAVCFKGPPFMILMLIRH